MASEEAISTSQGGSADGETGPWKGPVLDIGGGILTVTLCSIAQHPSVVGGAQQWALVRKTGYDFNDEILPGTASFRITLVQRYLRD